jgi:hypothetical protein
LIFGFEKVIVMIEKGLLLNKKEIIVFKGIFGLKRKF